MFFSHALSVCRFSPSASASSTEYAAALVDENPSGALIPLEVPLVVVGFRHLPYGREQKNKSIKVELMR